MFRTIKDFESSWAYEIEMTGRMLSVLTDQSLSQRVTNSGRTLGFLAWHLALTPAEMLEPLGLTIDAPKLDADCPHSAADIAETYRIAGESVARQVTTNWTDETLLMEDEMYGETWSRGTTLFNIIAHQAHHRGQITVLMRQAGLIVPGVYGPAKEEWAAMGAPALP